MSKIMVPGHRIPKVSALCPKCRGGTKIVAATAFADGYHRRHMCKDKRCEHAFYTLAPYDGGEPRQSPLPFRDRPLSEAEIDTRLRWWVEAESTPVKVTPEGNEPVTMDPFIQRLATAMGREEDERDTTEQFIVTVLCQLKLRVTQLDQE